MVFHTTSARTLLSVLCAGLFALTSGVSQASSNKPLRLIVPAPPGGTQDAVARALSDELSKEIQQPVFVENKPGGGGVIAVQALNSAPPDGNTLLVTANNLLTEAPLVVKVNFDPLKDLTTLAMVARTNVVLVSSPNLPATDLKSLISYIKSQPGSTSYASYSTGTVSHYAGVIFNQKAGLDMQHVPFPGSPPALAQVLGNQITVMFDALPTSGPMIAAGKVRAYGVASKTRSALLPNVPTFAEQGYPEIEFNNWVGVVASAKMPMDIQQKIRTAVLKATASPRLKERLAAQGFEIKSDLTQDQLAQLLKTEYDRNAGIVKAFNITVNH